MGKKVLVVEDHPVQGRLIRALCENLRAEVTWATTLKEAEEALNEEFDLIIWDGQLGKKTSVDLIRETRRWFMGDMIACSTLERIRQEQKEAGCNYVCAKDDLEYLLPTILRS